MIVANLATYPARHHDLMKVINILIPQVERLNLILNEYYEIPEELREVEGLNCILPHEDTKDVGKFYPDISDAEYVLLVDDDVDYPKNFVEEALSKFKALPPGRFLGGFHTSTYEKPSFGFRWGQLRRFIVFHLYPNKIARYRYVSSFQTEVELPIFVDQVGTAAAVMRGVDMPPYDYMRDSQKFVDVRLARWCFEQGIIPVALPRKAGWLKTEPDEQSIFRTFTQKHPAYVAEEIRKFSFKRDYLGKSVLDFPEAWFTNA